eukprot:CAMPEP_0113523750 /NCGR_PEP_ID=MMETSP0014_2-20120614/45863_1 /TAXON_ID=2857 /ORGANISM="Nitzschia sp." /LENGTH=486 /DNA_ID=CAMNT_0000421843 /DNA_START=621 /DNA_END=2081 /DNA_ORIENTATION=+ /assembly_acc=CAM_ASM_000159
MTARYNSNSNSYLQNASRMYRGGEGGSAAATATASTAACRLKFQSPKPWCDYHTGGVVSRQIVFDMVQAMYHNNNMQLLCCADLNIIGASAGTYFFQRNEQGEEELSQTTTQQDFSCIQLGSVDKIRIVQLPESEMGPLGRILSNGWKRHGGIQENNKYGIRGYKLAGRPWRTVETNNSINVDKYKLMIQILAYMESNGWNRVVPFDCSISNYDADSLLFFRGSTTSLDTPPPQRQKRFSEFCSVALEGMHKIRLVGTSDQATVSVFKNAVSKYWKSGVTATATFEGTQQVKCRGRPWRPNTTEENIASSSLICGVLQELWNLGWRWYCAVDMSLSVADKSTFFLSRNRYPMAVASDDDNLGGVIGCLQPKGSGKINLVSFPEHIMHQVTTRIRAHRWCVPLLQIARHGANCATLHFQCNDLHRSYRTAERMRTDRLYSELLTLIAGAGCVTMLGAADISGNYTSGGENSSPRSLDVDAFFFLFSK